MKNIGFIGLGIMGKPMAGHLIHRCQKPARGQGAD
ncbi:NAD(P)-binding domain-containing protein [Nitrosomonas sp.]